MNHPRPSATDSHVNRRTFLAQCAGLAATASLPGLLGCGEDLGPSDPWKLWVAKTLRGTVISGVTSDPLPFARVRFWCGLKQNELALLGEKITVGSGRYEMVATEHPGADAGFWRFIIDSSFFRTSSDDVPVYCQIEVSKPGFTTEHRDLILNRKPQKKLPPESEAFHLIQNIQLR